MDGTVKLTLTSVRNWLTRVEMGERVEILTVTLSAAALPGLLASGAKSTMMTVNLTCAITELVRMAMETINASVIQDILVSRTLVFRCKSTSVYYFALYRGKKYMIVCLRRFFAI